VCRGGCQRNGYSDEVEFRAMFKIIGIQEGVADLPPLLLGNCRICNTTRAMEVSDEPQAKAREAA
jgi:hypothetical protein